MRLNVTGPHSIFISSMIFFIGLSSCSPQVQQIRPLPPETEARIAQNLRNGRLPSPQDVISENVSLAPDLCETFKNSLPRSWFKNTIQVPENPQEPNGRKINIFYYGKIRRGHIPTVFFNGGPASSSHGSYRVLTQNQTQRDPERKISFIFIDQRGNGCSDFYPQLDMNDSTSFYEQLPRLAHYGSKAIVHDAEIVRRTLLGPRGQWNVFGQSYGAFIVHRYFIESAQSIHSAHAHANALQSDGYIRLKQRIASQVQVMNTYLARYPTDASKLQSLKNFLHVDRCYSGQSQSLQVCGHSIVELFAGHLLGFTDQWPIMHQWIELLVDRRGQVDEEQLERFIATFVFSRHNPLNTTNWANLAIGWVDRNVAVPDPYNCQRIQADLLREQRIQLQNLVSHQCLGALQENISQPWNNAYQSVRHLPRDLMTVAQLREALLRFRQTAFYLYSGQNDAYVPVSNFTEELSAIQSLSNVSYNHFQGSGHEGYFTENLVWQNLINHSTE